MESFCSRSCFRIQFGILFGLGLYGIIAKCEYWVCFPGWWFQLRISTDFSPDWWSQLQNNSDSLPDLKFERRWSQFVRFGLRHAFRDMLFLESLHSKWKENVMESFRSQGPCASGCIHRKSFSSQYITNTICGIPLSSWQ